MIVLGPIGLQEVDDHHGGGFGRVEEGANDLEGVQYFSNLNPINAIYSKNLIFPAFLRLMQTYCVICNNTCPIVLPGDRTKMRHLKRQSL